MDGQAPVYKDQSTGKVLDPKLVHKAMEEELTYMRGLPVWKEYATLSELQKNHPDLDRGVIGTRWVLVNNGDDLRPDVRARLGAQEVKYDHSVAGHDPTLFSATPPLEAMRAIISKSASDPRKIVGQIDIKKAHLYGVSTRKIAVRLPNGSFGFLLRTLYGTRDAASSWEHEVRRVMLLRNLVNGKASPCLYKDEVKDCALLIHGDDIIFSGFRKDFEARFAHMRGIAPARMTFETGAGVVRAEVRGERVKLRLAPPAGYRARVPLRAAGRRFAPAFIVVGVPHAVVRVDDLAAVPVEAWGRALRRHAAFAPAGATVNFYRPLGAGRLALRTYERGVEGETLACGTGSVATALVAAAAGAARSPVTMVTRGGEELTVHFRRRGTRFDEVHLEGGAAVVTGTILNIITVLVGGVLGLVFGARLPERIRQTVVAGLGLFTAAIGVKMFVKSENEIIVLGAILVGGVLGEWWRIEDGLRGLGGWLERRFGSRTLFAPLHNVAVYDHEVGYETLSGLRLIFLTRVSLSAETSAAVQRRVAEGATCVLPPRLAPAGSGLERIREITAIPAGAGYWLWAGIRSQ